ncbi:MAG: LLM class flavin-dependent oxidoreductase [Acidimicrobiaceae bacterium]
MKFGVLASHQFPFEDNLSLRLKELFSLTQLAADRGYDSVFTINHFLANLQTPQVISMTAAMLEYSGSMQVGTSILLLPFYHPVHIAEEFATLDQLSGGRMILGVGAGYRDVEFDTFGIDKKRRGARLAECVDVIRKMWTGEPVHHDGEFYKLDGVSSGVRPLQAGGPPIWIGAGAFPAIRRAARIGDAWLAPGNPPTDGWTEKAQFEYEDSLAASGKPLPSERPVVVELFCGVTDEDARSTVLPYIKDEYFTYSDYKQLSWQQSRFEFLFNEVFLIGSPATLIERINKLRDLGFNHIIFRHGWIGLPTSDSADSIRRFAEEVIPHFK